MNAGQKKAVKEIADRWQVEKLKGLTLQRACMDVAFLCGLLSSLEDSDAPVFTTPRKPAMASQPVEESDVPGVTPRQASRPTKAIPPIKLLPIDPAKPCRRGDREVDDKGVPFRHHYPKELGYCIFCNDGLPPPKTEPDPGSNAFEHGGEDKVWCGEHGWHVFKVNPDGSIINPPTDCAMFKAKAEL